MVNGLKRYWFVGAMVLGFCAFMLVVGNRATTSSAPASHDSASIKASKTDNDMLATRRRVRVASRRGRRIV